MSKLIATIRKWAALPFEDVRNVLSWLNSEKSKVDFNNPNLLIGSACDESGKPATYVTIEPTFVVSDYAFRPQLTDEAAGIAGDAIDSVIVREAQQRGIGKVLIVVPDDAPSVPHERWLRVVERTIPQEVTVKVNGTPITKRLSVSADNTKAEWTN